MLTHTEDVEAEPLRHRFANQLIREAVKSNMAAESQSPLFLSLRGERNDSDTLHQIITSSESLPLATFGLNTFNTSIRQVASKQHAFQC